MALCVIRRPSFQSPSRACLWRLARRSWRRLGGTLIRPDGRAGMVDRSSPPAQASALACPRSTIAHIIALRRKRWTGKRIVDCDTDVSPARQPPCLRRAGLLRGSTDYRSAGALPNGASERDRPGEMIHLDVEKLGRFQRTRPPHHRRAAGASPMRRARKQGGSGWEYVHVAIDDHSRLSFAQSQRRRKSCQRLVARLKAAVSLLPVPRVSASSA